MNVEYIRALYDYNRWAHDRVWECALQLTNEQFTRNIGYSWGSVRNQFVHVMSVDARWFARLKGDPIPDHLQDTDYPTHETVRAKWDEVASYARSYLDVVTEDAISQNIVYNTRSGGPKSGFNWQILLHVVNHGTDHRAQILAMLHQLGAPTIAQDLMFYFWEQ